MQSTLQRLVDLIRENPTMTGKQLARAMGYAEPRSLYHWVQKAGFPSLTPFRRAVLRGEYPPFAAPTIQLQFQEAQGLPEVIDGFSRGGHPIVSDATFSWPETADMTMVWSGPDVPALLRSGDRLLLQRPEDLQDGDWVLLSHERGHLIVGRLADVFEERVVVRPPYGEILSGSPAHVVARIIGLLRLFR